MLTMLTLFLLPTINAGLGTFKQGECVDVKTILNTTSVTLSSLSYPNGTIAVTSKTMTNIGGKTFNYTFCNTDDIGTYIYDYYDASGDVYVNDFDVTPNGEPIVLGKMVGYGFMLIIAIGLFCLLLFFGITIPYQHQRNEEGLIIILNQKKYLKILCIWLAYIVLIYISSLLNDISQSYLTLSGFGGMFEIIYFTLLSFFYPIFICFLIFGIINMVMDRKMAKALERGIFPQ